MHNVIYHAKDLPNEWDEVCKNNIYMSRSFLEFMEKANDCKQTYHLIYDNNELLSCFVMFKKWYNLFVFTKLKIFLPINFIYLPLSVSHPSIIWNDKNNILSETLKDIKGLKLILNVSNEKLDGFAKGNYLPICELENKWSSFEDYINSMRTNYRRRINKAISKGNDLKIAELNSNSLFDDQMYSLYEQVFNHSEYSLEKLSIDFFRNNISKTFTFNNNDKCIGFIQIIEDRLNDMLIFEFCGYDYDVAHDYDIYYNMLSFIVKYGIENNFKRIQLGQTAYDAKLKFGSKMYRNFYLLSHSNPLINAIIQKINNFLEFDVPEYNFNVFKEVVI